MNEKGGVMREFLEKEALKKAEEWAKERKIVRGKYPSMDEFFRKKGEIFTILCKKLKEEL